MKFLVLISTLLAPMNLMGAGSVALADLSTLLSTNRNLAIVLENSVLLDGTGSAVRLGNHLGDLGGTRVGPYEFEGDLAHDPGQSGRLKVTLHTDWSIQDAQGADVPLDSIQPGTTGLQVVEKLVRLEFESMGGALKGLVWTKGALALEEPESGSVRRGILDGRLQELEIYHIEGDHGGVTYHFLYNKEGQLTKIRSLGSSWKFSGPETTEDHFEETTLYFEEGKFAHADRLTWIEKPQDENQPRETGKKKLVRVEVTKQAADRFQKVAEKLRTAEDQQIVVLIKEIDAARRRLSERDVSLDDLDWKHVVPPKKRINITSKEAGEAGLETLRLLRIRIPQMEQPDDIWVDVLEEGDTEAIVLVTLRGMADDELEGERYKIEFLRKDGKFLLSGLVKQTKKWREDEWKK